MKKQDIFDALSNADDDLVERAADSMTKPKRRKVLFLFPIAATVTVISFVAVAIALSTGQKPTTPSEETDPPSIIETAPPQMIPITEIIESPEPEQGLIGDPYLYGSGLGEMRADGIYAKAKAVGILPDKYRFFSDKHEFCLVEMQTISALPENKMPERFYLILPEEYLVDLTAYPSLILHDMWQFSHENAVLYNTSQDRSEYLPLTIFASSWNTSIFFGSNIMAFDENGIFDISLWESTESWAEETARDREYLEDPSYAEYLVIGYGWTADRCEEAIRERQDKELAAASLLKVTNEAVLEAIEYAWNPENGLFVPNTLKDFLSFYWSDVFVIFRRYINGYPTDEDIQIDGDNVYYSSAKFTDADASTDIDLASAVNAISNEFDAGNITPPHLIVTDNLEKKEHGIFAWYAKTENGIVGVIKVSWMYEDTDTWYTYFDDKYFIIESGSSVCTSISRDDLLNTVKPSGYIFKDEYNEYGMNVALPMY